MEIRPETIEDATAIRALTTAAFADKPYSNGREAAIVDDLRADNTLTLSLVACENGTIVGHVAFSPVALNGVSDGWYGLGPVSVHPDRQRQGIGQALIRDGLARLQSLGARGCLLLGDPAYYGRFGFRSDPNLRFADIPPPYFQYLSFTEEAPKGVATFHPSFTAT